MQSDMDRDTSVDTSVGTVNELLGSLQDRYGLMRFPYRIECLDISHLGGDRTSAGLSCLEWLMSAKKSYRHYKIALAGWKPDDYASLREVLLRRFSPDKKDLNEPDLFILDGWEWQLGVVKKLMSDPYRVQLVGRVQFASLGKWWARKRAGKNDGQVEYLLVLSANGHVVRHSLVYDQVDRALVHARDESHRFANRYRKKQMSAQWAL